MPETGSGSSPAAQLRSRSLAPRKRLGQNFLRDPSFLARIVEAASLQSDDEVLEIGAGTGILTEALLARAGRVVAAELDDALLDLLRERFGAQPNLTLWHGNALDLDPCSLFGGPYKLVANIPYYITGPLVRRFLETACQPEVGVLMVQREVADRMAARPGRLSLLGVSVQYYAWADVVTRVPAGAFYPRPRVDSAIIRLVPYRSASPGDASFFEVVRAGFSQRRKQIANSLSAGLHLGRADVLAWLTQCTVSPSARAEDLSLDDWIRLSSARPQVDAAGV